MAKTGAAKKAGKPTIDLKASSDSGFSSTDNITRDTTPTLTGTADAGAKVTIKDGSTVIGTVTADSSGDWSFTTKALSDGSHGLTATAIDKDGNVSSPSPALTVKIDHAKPAAPTIDLKTASDSGLSSTDNLTGDATPTLTGKAEAGSTVTIKDGATVLGTVISDSSGKWSFTTDMLADGSHKLTATATDKAGNSSAASSKLTVTVDTTPPDAPSIDLKAVSDTGASSSDDFTSDVTPTLTGKAEAGATVTIKDGTTVIGTAVADSSGKWSFTASTLSEGSHSLTVMQTDKAGNGGPASAALIVTIDTTAPNTPTIALHPGFDTGSSGADGITSAQPLLLTGTADAGALVTISEGSTVLGSTYADENGDWLFASSVLVAGSHSLTATASDGAGNFRAASSALALMIDTVAPDASTIDLVAASDTGASSTDNLTTDATPTLAGTAEAGATVTVLDGSTVLGTTTVDGSGHWRFTAGALGDGAHSFTATVTDIAGNISSAPTALTVTVVLTRVDLTSLSLSDGFIIQGDTAYDNAGWSVSSAGDVNGDGFADVIIGAHNGDDGGNMAGEAYVVFGTTSGFGTTIDGRQVLDLTTLSTTQGFRILGDAAQYSTGYSVSGGGDVNGDGNADFSIEVAGNHNLKEADFVL